MAAVSSHCSISPAEIKDLIIFCESCPPRLHYSTCSDSGCEEQESVWTTWEQSDDVSCQLGAQRISLYLCQTPQPQQMTAMPALELMPPHLDITRSDLSWAPAAQCGRTSGPEHCGIMASCCRQSNTSRSTGSAWGGGGRASTRITRGRPLECLRIISHLQACRVRRAKSSSLFSTLKTVTWKRSLACFDPGDWLEPL